MGQQQLLFIVLGIILVGVAIIVGINLFRANAIDQKRNMLINELINLSAMAQQHYLKPTEYGGGGNSFSNFTIPDELESNDIGRYFISNQSAQELIIMGIGTELVSGTDSVKVQVTIPSPPANYQILIIN